MITWRLAAAAARPRSGGDCHRARFTCAEAAVDAQRRDDIGHVLPRHVPQAENGAGKHGEEEQGGENVHVQGADQAITPGPMAAETQIIVANRVATVDAASRFKLIIFMLQVSLPSR